MNYYLIIIGIGAAISIAAIFHTIGYIKGYRAGIAYGEKGLDEYHKHVMKGIDQHVMRNLDNVPDNPRRRDGDIPSP